MANDSRSTRRTSWLAMFAAAALTMGAGAASADDPIVAEGVTVPTQAQCQSGWNDSSAADTCGAAVTSNYYGSLPAATVTVWTGGEERRDEKGKWYWLITEAGCRVQVQCMPAGSGPDNTLRLKKGVANNWSGSQDDTADLHNINGTLTVQ